MTSESIGVGWSNDERATEYEIHRVVRTSDERPPVEAMTAETLIYTTDAEVRFTDEGVEAGTQYWHGVRTRSADGDLVAFGWHPTAAIDDEQPPIFVDAITAVAENGEVLVTWSEPDENYELHAYRVLRGVNGEPTEQIAVTWDLSQRSFVDDEPPASGQVVYEVVALDFHWNKSEPSSVTLTL